MCFKNKHFITISPSQHLLLKKKKYFAKYDLPLMWYLSCVMSDFEFWRWLLAPAKTRYQNIPFHGGKALWTLNEMQVYLWELVLLEGFPGLWGSMAGMFSACFSIRWLYCGSLRLWGTRYGYQVFFFSAGECIGQIKGIKRKQAEGGEITFPNLCYGARGNTGVWNGSALSWTKTSSEMQDFQMWRGFCWSSFLEGRQEG